MAITYGTITFNQYLGWVNRYENGLAGGEDPTLLGRLVVNRLGGNVEDIVIEAREEDNVRKGYFLKADLDSLSAYRDAGTTNTLNFHGESFDAVVRRDGIRVRKALWQSEFDTIEKWIGTITFKRTG